MQAVECGGQLACHVLPVLPSEKMGVYQWIGDTDRGQY